MMRITFLALMGCIVGAVFSAEDSVSSICLTEECEKIAQLIIENINETVNPCEDFYGYVCQGSINEPAHHQNILLGGEVFSEVEKSLGKIFWEPLKPEDNHLLAIDKKWYSSCMNRSRIDELGLKPLVDIIETLGGWPMAMNSSDAWKMRNISWEAVNDYYTSVFEKPSLFRFEVNDFDSDSIVFERELVYWNSKLFEKSNQFEELVSHVVNSYALATGENPNAVNVTSDIKDVLEFASKLFKMGPHNKPDFSITLPEVNFTDFQNQYDEFYIKNFSGSTARKINWQNVFNSAIKRNGLEHKYLTQDAIKVQDVPHFLRTSEILMTTPERTIVNYIIWAFVFGSINYLDQTTVSLYNKIIDQQSQFMEELDRSVFCYNSIPTVGEGTRLQFIQMLLSGNANQSITGIMDGIRKEMQQLIVNSTLIDAETKNRLNDSLRTAVWNPIIEGIPKFQNMKVFENLEINEDFFHNFIKVKMFEQEIKQNETRKQFLNGTSPFYQQDAYKKLVNLTWEDLSVPVFHSEAPLALNYGTLGFRLATRIVEQFISDDLIANVTRESSRFTDYVKNSKCLAGHLHVTEDMPRIYKPMEVAFLNEVVTLELTLKAYHHALNNMNLQELKLPKLDKLNNDKLFFVSFARAYCESRNKYELFPPIHRNTVNGMVRSMEGFSAAFECSAESNISDNCDFVKYTTRSQY